MRENYAGSMPRSFRIRHAAVVPFDAADLSRGPHGPETLSRMFAVGDMPDDLVRTLALERLSDRRSPCCGRPRSISSSFCGFSSGAAEPLVLLCLCVVSRYTTGDIGNLFEMSGAMTPMVTVLPRCTGVRAALLGW